MASLYKRNKTYWVKFYVGKKRKERSLRTDSYQVAREKIRQLESELAQGNNNPLPTRTPIEDVVTNYVQHIRTHKTPKSAQTDIYYLREAFGPICDALKITSRKPSAKAKKKPSTLQNGQRKLPTIEASCFEAVTTNDVSGFIASRVRAKPVAMLHKLPPPPEHT